MEQFVKRIEETLYVKVPKEVDHCFTDEVREIIDRRLQTEEIRVLEFDFSETEFMDSSGIGLLMGRYKLVKALHGEMRITHPGDRVKRILNLCGIYKIIQVEGV